MTTAEVVFGRRFEGKVAVVTASTQGIGSEGASIVVSSRQSVLLQDAAPHLPKGSSVIFISSIGGYQPRPSAAMYGVTKTALLGLTKALATVMAPDVRVNCVAPGLVPTRFTAFLTENEVTKKSFEDMTVLKRLGKTGEIVAATAFLASDDASYITRETLI